MKLADYLDHRGYPLTLRRSGSRSIRSGPPPWKIWLPGVMLVNSSSIICGTEVWRYDPAAALRDLVYRISDTGNRPDIRLGRGVFDPDAAVCPPLEIGDFLSGPPGTTNRKEWHARPNQRDNG